MGRPLSKQQLFDANSNNNIKVQFHNGTASVRGYIVEQTGSKRFKCKDENGVEARHRATFNYDGSVQSMPWGFGTSTSDGIWQVEEVGTSSAMTDAVDLEGDDINGDYPVPGSGTWKTAATALSGITYASIGTPYDPAGNVASVSNSAAGLLRKKYDGNFTSSSAALPATWDYTFFNTATFIKEIADEYVSWGQQIDGPGLGESLFSIEWKGYVQVPTTQNYNFYAESDDHIAMWIGTAATGTPANATRLLGSNNKSMPSNAGTAGVYGANSVTLTAGQWYPVRIWFSEHTGGCKAQVYAQGADGTKFNGEDLTWAYNTATGGF